MVFLLYTSLVINVKQANNIATWFDAHFNDIISPHVYQQEKTR